MGKFYQWLVRISTGRTLLTLFILTFLFNIVIMPGIQWQMDLRSGGVEPLDLSYYYTAQEAFERIEAFGEARPFYAMVELTADLLYPLVYGFFLSVLLVTLYRRGFAAGNRVQMVAFLPLLSTVFDYAENTSIAYMLLIYPAESPLVATWAGFFTLIKWFTLLLTIIAVLLGFVAYLVKGLRRR
jgi:hypothetical protein